MEEKKTGDEGKERKVCPERRNEWCQKRKENVSDKRKKERLSERKKRKRVRAGRKGDLNGVFFRGGKD